jgi:hypothetical protein
MTSRRSRGVERDALTGGYPADEWRRGQALHHLHTTGITLLHKNQHETGRRWGLHGEAGQLTESPVALAAHGQLRRSAAAWRGSLATGEALEHEAMI